MVAGCREEQRRKLQKTTTIGARVSKNHQHAIFFAKNYHYSVTV
jgi:hypothetical protein